MKHLVWFSLGLFLTVLVLAFVRPHQDFSFAVNPVAAQSSSVNSTNNQPQQSIDLQALAQSVVCTESDRGYMNTQGQLVITLCPRVYPIGRFVEGVAQVEIETNNPASQNDESGPTDPVGFINREGQWAVPPILTPPQFVEPYTEFSQGRLPVKRAPNRISYIDQTGRFSPDLQFSVARSFHEGLAAVCLPPEEHPQAAHLQCGYIDFTGHFVIEPKFKGVGSFHNGVAVVWTIDSKYGLIDRAGHYLVPPELDGINSLYTGLNGSEAEESSTTDFYSGLVKVRIPDSRPEPPLPEGSVQGDDEQLLGPGKWGYVRKSGGYAITPRFWKSTNFSQGRAIVQIGENDLNYPAEWRGQEALIDTAGQIVNTHQLDPQPEIWSLYHSFDANSFNKGIVVVAAQIECPRSDRLYGFLDRQGQWAIAPVFGGLKPFSEGVAAAQEAKSKQWGFINRAGQWVITPQFADADSFHQGLATVQDLNDGKWGFITPNGAVAIAPQFGPPQQFTRINMFLTNGLATVRVEGKFGLINKQGQYLLEPKYEEIGEFVDGVARVRGDAQHNFFINESGVVLPYTNYAAVASEGLVAVLSRLPDNFSP